MRYLLIDTHNMFHRAIHVTRGSADMRASMALHIILASINQAWRLFNADHVIVALECRTKDNWRANLYNPYKQNRAETRKALTEKEKEDNEIIFEMFNEFLDFIENKTNVTVLQCPIAEADDLIARWTQLHKDDDHVIISSDKDFYQLVSENIVQYNGVAKKIITASSSHLRDSLSGKLPKDWKEETIEDPEYFLFEKIVRGDVSDNIFSAFPGVRKNPGKGKPGIITAYEDRHNQGFDWNNFMMQKWTDHKKQDHLVKDCFERNTALINLTKQPDNVKESMDKCIVEAVQAEPKKQIGFHFMKFCGNHELNRALQQLTEFSQILSAEYK